MANRCVRLTDDEGRDEFFAMLSVEDLDEDWAWQRVSEYLREAEGDAYNRNMKEKKRRSLITVDLVENRN